MSMSGPAAKSRKLNSDYKCGETEGEGEDENLSEKEMEEEEDLEGEDEEMEEEKVEEERKSRKEEDHSDVLVNSQNKDKLNHEQRVIFNDVSAVIDKDMNNENMKQMLLFISGGAGTGKSVLLKTLVEYIEQRYSNDQAKEKDNGTDSIYVEVCALTGVAAHLISGKTLHRVFLLPIKSGKYEVAHPLQPEKLEEHVKKWRNINWLLIDEISMVSYQNLRRINLRLQEYKKNTKIFGGINVLLFGDLMQLPPVFGDWCFDQPDGYGKEIHLWRQFSFRELTVNMRHQNDLEFITILNNLRFGSITSDQYNLLKKRATEIIPPEEFQHAVRFFPKRELANRYNSEKAKLMSSQGKSHSSYVIKAVDQLVDHGNTPPKYLIPDDIDNCGGMEHELELIEGSRVMLRRNISIPDGLVNGSMGTVKKFEWCEGNQQYIGELPKAVIIKFDNDSAGNSIKDSNGYVRIKPTTARFQAKDEDYGMIERRMLPIILCWALTVHKLQGISVDKAVVDIGHENFAKGQVYVALSRVKTLKGLVVSNLHHRSRTLNFEYNESGHIEMERLRQLPNTN